MIVTIPYGYDAHYVKKNHRIPDRAPQIASVDVSIPDILDAECVFEVGNGVSFRWDSNPFMTVAGEPARVWQSNGRFFVQRERVERMVDLFCNGEEGHGNPFNTSGSSSAPKPFPDSLDQAQKRVETREQVAARFDIRSWDDDGGAKIANAIRRRAEELAIIDGWLCVPVSEPVLAIGDLRDSDLVDGSEHAIYMILTEAVAGEGSAFNGFRGVDDWAGFRRYSLADADAARAYGAALAHACRLEFRDAARIDRVNPDALSFRSEVEAVGRAARWITSQLGSHYAELPAKTGLAIRALREAEIDAGETALTPSLIYGLEQAVDCLPAREDPWHSPSNFPRAWWRSEGNIENWTDREKATRLVEIAQVMGSSALGLWATRKPGAEWVVDAVPVPAHFDGAVTVSQLVSEVEAHRVGVELGVDGLALAREAREQGDVIAVVSGDRRKALVTLRHNPSGYEAGVPKGEGGRPAPWASQAAEDYARAADHAVYIGADLVF